MRRRSDLAGYGMGLQLGGVVTAVGVLAVGSIFRGLLSDIVRIAFAAAVTLILLVREAGILRFPVLQNRRLVPQFVTRIPFWGFLQFGAEMGTGMRTLSPSGMPHIIAVALLLLADWRSGVLADVGVATGRLMMTVAYLYLDKPGPARRAFDYDFGAARW